MFAAAMTQLRNFPAYAYPQVQRVVNSPTTRAVVTAVALAALNSYCYWTLSFPWTLGFAFGITVLKGVVWEELDRRIRSMSWKLIACNIGLLYLTHNGVVAVALNFLIGAHFGSWVADRARLQNVNENPAWGPKRVIVTGAFAILTGYCYYHKATAWSVAFLAGMAFYPEEIRKNLTNRYREISWIVLVPSAALLALTQYHATMLAAQLFSGAILGSELSLYCKRMCEPQQQPAPVHALIPAPAV